MPPPEGRGWAEAFAECQRAATKKPLSLYRGTARLPQQPPVIIPPQTEMIVWTQVTGQTANLSCDVLIEPLPDDDSEWRVGRTLATMAEGKVPCRICTPNPYPVEVPQRKPVAQVSEVGEVDIRKELVLNSIAADTVEVSVQWLGSTETEGDARPPLVLSLKGDKLSPYQQEKLTDLLQKWGKVFLKHDEDFRCTGIVKHQIPTSLGPPSRERYLPVPLSLAAELRALLQNMLDSGVVRESASPWAAPIVLVQKKVGRWRFCVDCRRLNALTHKDAYPLPRIEKSLTGLKAARWYSTFDLTSGYWQVEVDPADREKTAFTTPFGLYEFE